MNEEVIMRTLKSIELVLALVVLSTSFSACEKEYLLSVENTAGNLESVMGKVKNVSTLKISGPLNGDDIFYLREILTSKSNKGSILDLSDASIVEGGIAYIGDSNGDGIGNCHTSKDEIGDAMFYKCKFKTIILPKGVTSIGGGAFLECTSLKEITIPNSVMSIGGCAFEDCTSLKELAIPDSVTSIGGRAFYGCTSLNSVTVGNGVKSIKYNTFGDCTNLANVVIGKNVESIGDSAFSGCSGLMEITLPGNITEIGEYSFSECINLEEIAIPDSVTSIGTRAFYGCTNLYTLIIGGGVTTIGDYAFDSCDRLYEFYCHATTPPSIGSKTFTKPNTFLYVPKDSLEAYKTAWGKYFTNISEMN